MSEYFVGRDGQVGGGADADPMEPPLPGEQDAAGARPAWWDGPEQVRFGIPFNRAVPIWHDGTDITWHRALDGTDFAQVLGMGDVATRTGPSPVPMGWRELVEVGSLEAPAGASPDSGEVGPVLVLRAAAPRGRRAQASEGEGVRVPLSPALPVAEVMGATAADFDITGFSVHVARLMLRAARDGAILLITLRAPRDPEAHHLVSVPSEVDADGVMHFHLGTLLEVDAPTWAQAQHAEGMSLLDLEVPYASLLAAEAPGADPAHEPHALDTERLIAMAQPLVDAALSPGFPFALGASVIVRGDVA